MLLVLCEAATKKRAQRGPQNFLLSPDRLPAHAWGEVPLPLGETTGGHGVPGVGLIPGLAGDVPPLLPWLFVLPGVDGLELEEPEFGVEPGVPLVVPGNVPQGEPLGELPGLFGVLGLMVDGSVVLPGVGLAGVFEPGTFGFGVPLGDVDPGVVCGVAVPAGGVAVLAGGVAVLAGGVAVPAGGVAGDPGVEDCPAGGAPPEGAVCATAQLAQHSTTDSNVSFDFDIRLSPSGPSVNDD